MIWMLTERKCTARTEIDIQNHQWRLRGTMKTITSLHTKKNMMTMHITEWTRWRA